MGLSREAEGGVDDVDTRMVYNFVLVVHGADRERDLAVPRSGSRRMVTDRYRLLHGPKIQDQFVVRMNQSTRDK